MTLYFVQMTGYSMMQLIMQLIGLARHDPRDNGSGKAIVKLRELQHEFVQREIMFQPTLYISVFLMTLEPGSLLKEKLSMLVNDNYHSISFETVVREFNTHFRDQEISIQVEEDLYGKRKQRQVNAAKAKFSTRKEFGDCIRQGICYHCYAQGKKGVKYGECEEHNSKKTVQAKKVSTRQIREPSENNTYTAEFDEKDHLFQVKELSEQSQVEGSRALVLKLHTEAEQATRGLSEELRYDEALCHSQDIGEDEEQVTTINSVMIVDSGASDSTVPTKRNLSDVQQIDGPLITFANGDVGRRITQKGLMCLNGYKIPAYVSDDVNEGLLSTSQLDRELGCATLQYDSSSTSFVPTAYQRGLLRKVLSSIPEKNRIVDAELKDGLYVTNSNVNANSAIFPRIECQTMAQRVWFMHASLGHMPKEALCAIARNDSHNMFAGFPSDVTEKSIRRNWFQCKSCMISQQRGVPFYRKSRADIHAENTTSSPRVLAEKPGDYGQMDLWGPYPLGRQGYSYLFTMIDVYSQYQVSIKAKNEPGGSPRLVKKCLEKFQSLGVFFTRMIGDKQYGNEAVLSVLHTAYANRAGVQFIQAVPDEHQSQGVVERFFQSGQRRAAAAVLSFLDPNSSRFKHSGLDALVYAMLYLNHTPRRKFGYNETPSSIVTGNPMDLNTTLCLPFGLPVITHEKVKNTKLHGHGNECIYLIPAEGGSFRAGLFFNN